MTQNNVIPFPTRSVEPSAVPFSQNSALPTNIQLQSSVFEIQNYVPEGKKIHLIEESKGTHQIPHKIFEFMIKSTETRVEAAVFACLIRYTLGFHRSTCETSHTFIAEWTGYSVTSVRRGLDALLKANLIRCVEAGHSHKESTVYEVGVVKGYLESLAPSLLSNQPILSAQSNEKSGQSPGNLDQLKSNQLCLQGAQFCADIRHSTVPCAGTKKDNTNKETNKTLSLTRKLPEFLKVYFSNLNPESKKQRELKFFLSFKNSYPLEDIATAVQYLVEVGIPGTGEKVHSPMAFLACSIGNVLPVILAEKSKVQRKIQRDLEEAKKKDLEAQETAQAETRFSEALAKFNQAFPTRELQNDCFQSFAKRFPILSGNFFGLRNAAISEWAAKQNN